MDLRDVEIHLYYELVDPDAKDIFSKYGKLPVVCNIMKAKGEELSLEARELAYKAYQNQLLVIWPSGERKNRLILYSNYKNVLIGVEEGKVTPELLLRGLLKEEQAESESIVASEELLKQNREDYETEKQRWIKKHGSEHLKLLIKDGFSADVLYIQERAEQEFPGFKRANVEMKFMWEDVDSPMDPYLVNEFRKVMARAKELGLPREKLALKVFKSSGVKVKDLLYSIWIESYLNQQDVDLYKIFRPTDASSDDELLNEKVGLTI